MIRTSKHILKFSNKFKLDLLEQLYIDYKEDLNFYINEILSNNIPLKINLSSKLLPTNRIKHSQWKQIIYKQASEIIRSQIKKANNKRYKTYKKLYSKCKNNNIHLNFTNKKFNELKLNNIIYTKYFTIPNVKNISINIDNRLLSNKLNSLFFDEFIGLKLPYFYENKKRAIQINLPIKWHKQSLKYQTWNKKNTIQLSKINNNFYLTFIYEKPFILNNKKDKLGIDIGYKKLITTSNEEYIGIEKIQKVYDKLSRQEQGSKNFKQTLKERDKLINESCNNLNLKEVGTIFVENLKNVKHKSKQKKKINTKFMNKLQRWNYPKVLFKLKNLCEEQGIMLEKVSPSYTSQTCSNCGSINKSNRKGEIYQCDSCNMKIDADLNAAINILHRGVYNLSNNQNKFY